MMKKSLFPILAVLALFASCEKVVEFDTTASKAKPVLNAIPSAGKTLFVNYGNTRFFLDDNNEHPISNADITITVNNTTLHPTGNSHCNYFFDYQLQEDDRLQIAITNPDGSRVSSSTYVPRLPRIDSVVSYIDTTQVFNVGIIQFNLHDYAGYPEYYHFAVQQRDSGCRYNEWTKKYDTVDTTYYTYFLCYTPQFTDPSVSQSEALGGYFYSDLLATDQLADGQTVNANFLLMLLIDTNEVQPFLHQYTMIVESVTPDRFRYLKDVATATSLTTVFAEPSQVYSNVDGALGIFAGAAIRRYKLDIDPSILRRDDNAASPRRHHSLPLPFHK
ncbi:MAG: DUF4249 domain-containing protein [Bacteroidales bacterium]|nr:DUF4249 domain-containing protein [Bacteroidales bacterium]